MCVSPTGIKVYQFAQSSDSAKLVSMDNEHANLKKCTLDCSHYNGFDNGTHAHCCMLLHAVAHLVQGSINCVQNILKEKKKTTPFGINLLRSPLFYRAAQQNILHNEVCKMVWVILPGRLLKDASLDQDRCPWASAQANHC